MNVDESNPLVYDFYGFPKHYYEERFSSQGSSDLLSAVQQALRSDGVGFKTEKRGLDHGVWGECSGSVGSCLTSPVPLKAAFGDTLDVPLLQVSLPGDGDPRSAARLGRALAPLR